MGSSLVRQPKPFDKKTEIFVTNVKGTSKLVKVGGCNYSKFDQLLENQNSKDVKLGDDIQKRLSGNFIENVLANIFLMCANPVIWVYRYWEKVFKVLRPQPNR